MKLLQRTFSGDSDKDEMIALARLSASENIHVIDLPYRFSSWAFEDSNNVALWRNEAAQLIGWAVLQTPFWTIDYACHPSVESQLHRKILTWADERAHAVLHTAFGHPAWYIMVSEGQSSRIHDLETAGFQCQADVGEDSWSKVLMKHILQTPVKVYSPPSGYKVRLLLGEEEVEAYVELHRSVFESKNMTVDWRLRTLHHPAYRRDLDVVVEAPDGRLVAFCIGWCDETSKTGQIEPLGCHKDFRRFALGRVALSECLQRLQSAGAKAILVETDSYRNTAFRLYESLGFDVIQNILVYRKDYKG